jgi:hypothetical protein
MKRRKASIACCLVALVLLTADLGLSSTLAQSGQRTPRLTPEVKPTPEGTMVWIPIQITPGADSEPEQASESVALAAPSLGSGQMPQSNAGPSVAPAQTGPNLRGYRNTDQGVQFEVQPWSNLHWGDETTIYFGTANFGDADVTQRIYWRMYLSTDSYFGSGDYVWYNLYSDSGLQAGYYRADSWPATLPSSPPSGFAGLSTVYVGMYIDPYDEISETDESDNANLGMYTDWDYVTVVQGATPTNTMYVTATPTRTRTATPSRTPTRTATRRPGRNRMYVPLLLRKPTATPTRTRTPSKTPTLRPPQELAYDDGEPDARLFHVANQVGAVRFTVPGPRRIQTLRYYLKGEMKYVRLAVYNSSWQRLGMREVIPSIPNPQNGAWFDYDFWGENVTVNGDFYVVLQWMSDSTTGPWLGLDEDAPHAGRSYEGAIPPSLINDGDALIRVVVR